MIFAFQRKVAALFLLSPFCFLSANLLGNAVGTDQQTFHPSHDGKSFVTVNSGDTLNQYELHLGLFANYALNSLVYFSGDSDSPQSRGEINDRIGTVDLIAAIGILDWWDIGVSVPFVFDQDVKDDGRRIQYFEKGNTEVRVATKFRLWQANDTNIALLGSFNLKRTENNPFTGEDSFNVFNIEAAIDRTFNQFRVAANLGFRYRQKGSSLEDFPGVEPLNHQILGSVAASYTLPNNRTELIGEFYSSFPTEETLFDSERSLNVLEALFSVKQEIFQKFWLHAGIGTELTDGLFTPDWRGFLGLHWDVDLAGQGQPAYEEPTPQATFTPAPYPETAPKPAKTIVLRNAVFAFNSASTLLGSSQTEIRKIGDYLNSNSFEQLVIEGHSCDLGSASYNKKLSKKRADRIKSILINQYRVDSRKIVTLGVGEARPEVSNTNEKNRQFNRRVEFKIYK